jgi:hypothetical protein
MLIPHNGQVYKLVVPLSRKQLLAVLVQCGGYDKFDQTDVGCNGLGRQSRLVHLRNQRLDGRIVDVRKREVSKVRVEPLVSAVLPRLNRGGLYGFAFSAHRMIHEPFGLLGKRNATCGFNERLSVVNSTGGYNFVRFTSSLASG